MGNLLDKKYYKQPEMEIYNIKKSFRFFHKNRFKITRDLVKKYNKGKGKKIIDLCCGLCEWNTDKHSIIGLDINKKALKIAKKSGRISKTIQKDALKNNLKSNYADIIVCTETLEHFKEPFKLILEWKRILKRNGILIISVPYDTFLSLWRHLFFLRCFWEGTLKRKKYYLKGGGHVNHFSPKKVSSLLEKHNFKILEIINNYRLNFFIVAQNKK